MTGRQVRDKGSASVGNGPHHSASGHLRSLRDLRGSFSGEFK